MLYYRDTERTREETAMRLQRMVVLIVATVSVAVAPAASAQPSCPIKLGGILSLTGSLGAVGKPIADTARMAVEHVNAAGGVKGCPVEFILRDDQGQSTVGVDAAKNLVDVQGVPALIGAISSGVSLPILSSVAVPAKVVMVSCCSTSPTFTTLAQEGKTGGYWFRTIPTTKTMAYAAAQLAAQRGYRKVAVIYVNTDFGVNLGKDFARAMQKLGGSVVVSIPYQENQPSYRAEVSRALAASPDSAYLIAFPQDGATLAREWLSFGGTQSLLLNNALRADQFVKAVGARFLQNAYGMDSAQVSGPSVERLQPGLPGQVRRGPQRPRAPQRLRRRRRGGAGHAGVEDDQRNRDSRQHPARDGPGRRPGLDRCGEYPAGPRAAQERPGRPLRRRHRTRPVRRARRRVRAGPDLADQG